MAVITISRQYGSGGDEIAARLGELLGYPHFNKTLIQKAAAEAGISEPEILDYSEESHKVQGFLERLFSPRSFTATSRVWLETGGGARFVAETALSEEMVLSLVQKAIRSGARQDNMIIIGRGGQAILRDEPNALHVRVEAPIEDRIARVKEILHQELNLPHTDLELRRRAQDLITERDAASADYLKRFYHIDWADPIHYHLVLNTGRMTIFQAADIIAVSLRTLAMEHSSIEPA